MITVLLSYSNIFMMVIAEENMTLDNPPPLASSLSSPLPLSLSHRYPLEVHNVVLISPRLPQENSSCVCVCELLLPACDSAQCICVFVCVAAFNPFVRVCVCV